MPECRQHDVRGCQLIPSSVYFGDCETPYSRVSLLVTYRTSLSETEDLKEAKTYSLRGVFCVAGRAPETYRNETPHVHSKTQFVGMD